MPESERPAVPAEQATPRTSPSDRPAPDSLAQLTQRVAKLERRYTDLLEAENRRLRADLESARAGDRTGVTGDGITAASTPAPGKTLPGPAYLAVALLEVERDCTEMELRARLEDWAGVRDAKLAAASAACRALRRCCEDPNLTDWLERLALNARDNAMQVRQVLDDPATIAPATSNFTAPPAPAPSAGATNVPPGTVLLAQESELLQLAGLTAQLAVDHLGSALGAYKSDPESALRLAQNPTQFMQALMSVRDAACTSADLIALGAAHAKSRARWKRILINGLGGTLIVGVNAGATTLLGPVGLAVSGALGSAALGVAASAADE